MIWTLSLRQIILFRLRKYVLIISNFKTTTATLSIFLIKVVDGTVLIDILNQINDKVTNMATEMAFLKEQISLIKKKEKNEPIWLTEVVSNCTNVFSLIKYFK